MTEIYLHFQCKHYGLYGNAPVSSSPPAPLGVGICNSQTGTQAMNTQDGANRREQGAVGGRTHRAEPLRRFSEVQQPYNAWSERRDLQQYSPVDTDRAQVRRNALRRGQAITVRQTGQTARHMSRPTQHTGCKFSHPLVGSSWRENRPASARQKRAMPFGERDSTKPSRFSTALSGNNSSPEARSNPSDHSKRSG